MIPKGTIENFVSKIREWAKSRQGSIDEIVLIGSQAKQTVSNELSKKSDIDLMIFLSESDDSTSIYSDLATIGIDLGILIHPLIISSDERNIKLKIPEYHQAYEGGRIIFKN